MSTTPPDLATVDLTSEGLVITLLDGTAYTAVFSFPVPMEKRTCTDGSHGKAFPDVLVTDDKGLAAHWHIGGRAKLPEVVNNAVASHFKDVVEREHAAAGYRRLLPVPEAVVEQFRQTDPDATVEEIRLADAAHRGMVADLGMGSRTTALWIARNYIQAEVHYAVVEDLEADVVELEDKNRDLNEQVESHSECSSSGEDEPSPKVAGILSAVELLRTQGAKVLEFRAGRDDVEKVIDLLDAA